MTVENEDYDEEQEEEQERKGSNLFGSGSE